VALVQGEMIKKGAENVVKKVVKQELEEYAKKTFISNIAVPVIGGVLVKTAFDVVKKIPTLLNAVQKNMPAAKYNQGQLQGIELAQQAFALSFKTASLVEFGKMVNELISLNPAASAVRTLVLYGGTAVVLYNGIERGSEVVADWAEGRLLKINTRNIARDYISLMSKNEKITYEQFQEMNKQLNTFKKQKEIDFYYQNLLTRYK
jgi:archaellum component FlaC